MFEKSKLFAESWNVAWRQKAPGSILSDKTTPFCLIKNPLRFWAADPFIFEYDGKIFVFAELYDYVRRRGIIGYYEFGQKKWIPAIIEPYHLSFPYIFVKGNNIYIMPEARESKSIYLYKAVSFPDKWEKCDVLFENTECVDTVIWDEKKTNYLLTYNMDNKRLPKLQMLDINSKKTLSIENSESNDIKRPAGKYFHIKDKIIRPSQIGINDYGKGLAFFQCELMQHQSLYKEKVLCSIYPDELSYSSKIYLDGMHTYNCCSNYEVIDIKTRRFNLLNFVFRLLGKIL